ncbi:hypothetical protein EUX98_g5310 [Antrodiella citrinella]|uniref:GH16 domain-containing protein n=1 Tax=Antrodiella citrinella TaxID=2447956 RepID=A0A4S4MUN3_9APHY|nr:hypothetical protein EUX98_g5310 [Antrodiella citrinella]
MPSGRALGLAALATSIALANAQTYTLADNFTGANFFNGFKYNASAIDSNNFGNVHFLSQSAATQANLTFIDSNGHAIITVDNTTSGAGDPSFGRNSVYLLSNSPLNIGSLLVFDANHIPFGCSVWPGFFTQGAIWPQQGEIDIIENVNLATINQYSLHVADTCNQPASAAQQQSGKTTSTNCTVVPSLDINNGCIVQETQQNSFGSGFATAGGGVYAMQWNDQGVSVWFFSRPNVPSDISSDAANPNPSNWGLPSAFYPASGCDPTTVFGPQFITLYIDICGAFAGAQSVFEQTCASAAPNCSALVQDPANYADAYWDINFLRVFTTGNNSAGPTTGAPSSTGSSGASPTSGGSASGSGSGSGNAATSTISSVKDMMMVPVAAGLFALLAFMI